MGRDYTYTPDADFNGVDSFTYTSADDNGELSIGDGDDHDHAVTLPLAVDDSDTTDEGVPVTTDVLTQ